MIGCFFLDMLLVTELIFSLDNLEFENVGEEHGDWQKRKFKEHEIKNRVFEMEGDRTPGQDGFPMASF